MRGDKSRIKAKDQEGHYWDILQTMTEGFALQELICDENGEPCDLRILNINPAFELLTGFSRGDILGRTFSQLLPNDDPALIKVLGAVAATGKPTKFESHSRTLGRYYEVVAYSSAPFHVSVLFFDVTQKKELERNLAKSQARSRAIIASIPDQILILAEDGTFLDYGSSAQESPCTSSEPLPGKRIEEILPLDLANKIKAGMNQTRIGSAIHSFDYKFAADGDERHYEVNIAFTQDNEFVVLMRDISARKQMERALLESESRFQAAIDNFPYTFIIYDRSLHIRYINRAGLLMCGMSEEEVLGHTDEELFASSITSPYMPSMRKARDTRAIQTVKSVQQNPSGRAIIVFNYVPILNEQGEICQILGINFDITELEEAKKRLETALAENKIQNRLLRTTLEDLNRNYREMGELLGNISRDLIVPISTVEGFLGLLKKDIEKRSQVRIDIDIGLISDAIARMQSMVGDALERSSLGIMDEASKYFPFSEITAEVSKHFKDSIAAGNLKIIFNQDYPSVRANRSKVKDVLISIVDGCLRCFEGGEVPVLHVGHIMNDEGSVFFVRSEDETGHKPPEDVFSPGSGDANPEDFGFAGLALAKRMVEAQGGRMWIESEAEAGCAILFTFPDAEEERALR